MSTDAELDRFISHILAGNLLLETEIELICKKAKELLVKDGSVISVPAPITIVGDIHGQFYDVLELFRITGSVPDTNFLFLGDYVDRGMFSIETISLLLCYKLRFPDRIYLLRGNHESRRISQVYGFYSECVTKYGHARVWHLFTDLFDFLSLAAIVGGNIFCVHGGLSPSLTSIDQIRLIDRFEEVPTSGPITDLLWSDPSDDHEGFVESARGVGFTFGGNVVKKFIHTNGMKLMVRSHQLCMDGYQELFDGTFVTIWSAPNYCYRCGNVAAVMEISDDCQRVYNVFLDAPDAFRKKILYEENKNCPSYFL